MATRGLIWEKKQRRDHVMVVLSGELNEAVDLSPLQALEGNVTFDLAGIRRINSGGARC
jgi:ABC-type transporter Mla MlaB component